MGGELDFLVNGIGMRNTSADESDDEEGGGRFIGSVVSRDEGGKRKKENTGR